MSFKTVFCIGFMCLGSAAADWYNNKEARDDDKGSTGAEREVYFEFKVPMTLSDDQVTAMADDMAWFYLKYPAAKIIEAQEVEA